MAYVKFLQNVYDDGVLVWKEGSYYSIESLHNNVYYVSTENDDEEYGIDKDLEDLIFNVVGGEIVAEI